MADARQRQSPTKPTEKVDPSHRGETMLELDNSSRKLSVFAQPFRLRLSERV